MPENNHYLSKEELKTVSPINIIDAITDTDESIVNEIVEENIEIFKSCLTTYDTEDIFSRRGQDRHKLVMKYLKDAVAHDIYMIHSRSQANESVQTRYTNAMMWLEKIGMGKITANLPKRDRDKDGVEDGSFRLGGNPKYRSQF